MAAWRKAEGSAYVTAIRLGCLEEAKRHMVIKKKANGYWTRERVLVSARRCATMAEWRATEPSARTAAMRNGWKDEACAHMVKRRKRGADD